MIGCSDGRKEADWLFCPIAASLQANRPRATITLTDLKELGRSLSNRG